MAFQEKRDYYGFLKKAITNFGKSKSIAVTPFNGRSYIHISDNKMCFTSNGGFDYSKSKYVSFSMGEAHELIKLLQTAVNYEAVFQGQEQTPPPPPPPPVRPPTPRPIPNTIATRPPTPQAMRNIFESLESVLPPIPLDTPPQPQIIAGQQLYQVVQSEGTLNDGEDEVFFAVPIPTTPTPSTSKQQ